MGLSVVVALVLTPALWATWRKPCGKGHVLPRRGPFAWSNRGFDAFSGWYQGGVRRSGSRLGRYGVVYLAIVGGLVWLFLQLPGSFLPTEDRGSLLVLWSAPPSASMERTVETAKAVEAHFLEQEKEAVEGLFTIGGFSFAGAGQNMGLAFVRLKDWSERETPELGAAAVAGRAMAALSTIKDAMVFTVLPPSVPGLGTATGFNLQLVDRAGLGHTALLEARNQLLGAAAQDPSLVGVRPNGMEDTPQYRVEVDREKARALSLSLDAVNRTLSTRSEEHRSELQSL